MYVFVGLGRCNLKCGYRSQLNPPRDFTLFVRQALEFCYKKVTELETEVRIVQATSSSHFTVVVPSSLKLHAVHNSNCTWSKEVYSNTILGSKRFPFSRKQDLIFMLHQFQRGLLTRASLSKIVHVAAPLLQALFCTFIIGFDSCYGTFAQRISHCSALNGVGTNMHKVNLVGVVYSWRLWTLIFGQGRKGFSQEISSRTCYRCFVSLIPNPCRYNCRYIIHIYVVHIHVEVLVFQKRLQYIWLHS